MTGKKKLVCIAALFTGFVSCTPDSGLNIECVRRTVTASENTHYCGNRAPLQSLHFVKLPVGAIQPDGWLKEYLYRQRDGMTGHLDEISPYLQKNGNAWLNPGGNGKNGWEELPSWLKGYANLGYILKDEKMIAEATVWFEGVLNSQRDDGFFGPWVEDSKKSGRPDLWGNMIMLWCLQSYYEYSNDQRVIPFMTGYFRWQLAIPDDAFLKDYWENSRGGDNLYSVYWLYNITGESFLLDLADKIHRNTADWRQDSNLPNWHNVNIAMCFREPATWWMQSKDSADLNATYNNFWLIRRTFGQVPGGMFGADEVSRLGYIDPRQGVETCGMVEQMASDELLLRITGDPFWADHCEDVAFNTYPAAVMPDFKALRYITSPNMLVSDDKDHYPGIMDKGIRTIMNPFGHRCCQHNHAQGWPYYTEHLWLATPDNGLAAVLFCANSVTAKVADGTEITITEETNYPFEEQVRMCINTPKNVDFPMYIRIPAWTKNARILLNGSSVHTKLESGSYARISRVWKDGDVLTIHFPMSINVRQWAVNQNSISVDYGPLTFSLKIDEQYVKRDSKDRALGSWFYKDEADAEEWPAWEIHANSPWNYGLQCNMANPEQSFKVVKKTWPQDNFPFTVESVPIEIKARGRRIPSWGIDRFGLCAVLPAYPANATGPLEEITLIPMGAARLRISAFPPLN